MLKKRKHWCNLNDSDDLEVNELENVSFSDMQNFFQTLTAADMYSLLSGDNLTQTIKMQ